MRVYVRRRHGCLTAIALLVLLAVVVTFWPVIILVAITLVTWKIVTLYQRRRRARAVTSIAQSWWSLPDERFETELVNLLGRLGWTRIEWGGPDIVAVDPAGRRTAVTWRKFAPGFEVGAPVVAQAVEAVVTAHADRAMLVTTGRYSSAAFASAQRRDVQLIDAAVLSEWAAISDRITSS
jgi:HJR/Mrr/RecB family endonuclease